MEVDVDVEEEDVEEEVKFRRKTESILSRNNSCSLREIVNEEEVDLVLLLLSLPRRKNEATVATHASPQSLELFCVKGTMTLS